jgi:hypothetical protein
MWPFEDTAGDLRNSLKAGPGREQPHPSSARQAPQRDTRLRAAGAPRSRPPARANFVPHRAYGCLRTAGSSGLCAPKRPSSRAESKRSGAEEVAAGATSRVPIHGKAGWWSVPRPVRQTGPLRQRKDIERSDFCRRARVGRLGARSPLAPAVTPAPLSKLGAPRAIAERRRARAADRTRYRRLPRTRSDGTVAVPERRASHATE